LLGALLGESSLVVVCDMSDVSGSVPLCYIYPAMIHYKACAKTRKEKVADITLMVFGFVAAVYTTVQTIRVSDYILLRPWTLTDFQNDLVDGDA